MEIKTTAGRMRETAGSRIVPPPDKGGRVRRKAENKLGKGQIAGRRLLSALKLLGKLGALFMVLILVLSFFLYAYSSDKFNLRSVELYGCRELDPEELEGIIRSEFPASVLRIDLRSLKDRLEKETWARRVEIRRILPSDLVIYVQERTPAAIVEIRDELMLVDRDGVLLCGYDPKYGKLDGPVFKGLSGEDAEGYRLHQEENAARIAQGLEMLAEIEAESPHDTMRISEVDLSDRKNLKVLMVDDIAEVHLGNQDYGSRFRTLMENMGQYRQLKDEYGDIGSIDLRFDDRIVWLPIRTKEARNSKGNR